MNHSPKDFAESVFTALKHDEHKKFQLRILEELFETLYFASLKTEESQSITLHIVYLDPDNPDPSPPERIRNDRWKYVPLLERVRVDIPSLVKIAKASDPRTSSFAVYHDKKGNLFIHGLVDQGNSYHDFVNHVTESGFVRPGIFQASIVGIGHIVASMELEKVAELKVNSLKERYIDIFSNGPILDALAPGINNYIDSSFSVLNNTPEDRRYWR